MAPEVVQLNTVTYQRPYHTPHASKVFQESSKYGTNGDSLVGLESGLTINGNTLEMGDGDRNNLQNAVVNETHLSVPDMPSATGFDHSLTGERVKDSETTLNIANTYGVGPLTPSPASSSNNGGGSIARQDFNDDIVVSSNRELDQKKKLKEECLLLNRLPSSRLKWNDIQLAQAILSREASECEEAITDLSSVDLKDDPPMTDTFKCAGATSKHASSLAGQSKASECRRKKDLDSICSINLGMDDTIYRWKLGSTITYNVNNESFPTQEFAAYASKCLEKATTEWNDGNIGVRFERVADDGKAVFRLEYLSIDKNHRSRLANAFLPEPQLALQRLWVYELAFSYPGYSMVDIFCHELGHVLGLRHEFSLEKEKSCPSVQWGPRNPSSIMSYSKSFCIQETDTAELKRFYQFRGKEYKGFDIIDLDPKYF